MKKSAIAILMTLCACNSDAAPPWKAFLEDPSTTNFNLAIDAINNLKKCQGGWYSDVIYADSLNSLFHLISIGNEDAFNIGLLIYPCLDGGNLGDFYRSAGLFFEESPFSFLNLIENSSVRDEDLKNMVIMLPLGYTDNIQEKKEALKTRIQLASENKSNVDNQTVEKVITFLTENLAFYENLVTQ